MSEKNPYMEGYRAGYRAAVTDIKDEVDTIEGSVLYLPHGGEVWVHTQYQIRKWLKKVSKRKIKGVKD